MIDTHRNNIFYQKCHLGRILIIKHPLTNRLGYLHLNRNLTVNKYLFNDGNSNLKFPMKEDPLDNTSFRFRDILMGLYYMQKTCNI